MMYKVVKHCSTGSKAASWREIQHHAPAEQLLLAWAGHHLRAQSPVLFKRNYRVWGVALIPHDDSSWNILAEASVDGGLCPSADSRKDTNSGSQLSCLQASSVCQADLTQSGLTKECSSCFSTCNAMCNKLAAGDGVTRCSSIHWLHFLPTTSAFFFI